MIAWDLETYRIEPHCIAPKPVCLAISDGEIKDLVTADSPEFDRLLEFLLSVPTVGHNIAYDLGVVMAHRPHLTPAIFEALEKGLITDTQIREKLIRLALTGDLKNERMPDGSERKISYRLTDLERKYLDQDRSDQKGAEDTWQLNYHYLDGVPLSEWPEEARAYPIDDAYGTWRIWEKQESLRERGVFETEHFRTRAAFALHLQTLWGFAIDLPLVKQKEKELLALFDEENFPHMVQQNILKPSTAGRPYANQVRRALVLIGVKHENEIEDWEPYRSYLEGQGVRYIKPRPASINTAALHSLVKEICADHNLEVPLTKKGSVSFAEEAQKEIGHLHVALQEYCHRQELAKLVTTEIPRIKHDVVHPRYDVLKSSGRVSSYGSKKGVPVGTPGNPYPSVNIQQIDPRIRECYVARPGHVLCSVDFDYLELVSAAQKCLNLFGRSQLADTINAGMDPHGFLGAQLCLRFDQEFRGACESTELSSREDVYEAFVTLKELDEERFDHYRTFAKPTGLGYWGGLGAETFVTYAKVTYGVDLVAMAGSRVGAIELAKEVKDVWFQAIPEAQPYFTWINNQCKDVEFCSPGDDRYCYQSPLGMIRRNCSFTEAANGAALQTPSAEGALEAQWNLSRLCYDPTVETCLLGCKPVAFIHDQIITEMPRDQWMHERAQLMTDVMVAAMRTIMPDVRVGAQPVLSLRWSKKAKPAFTPEGRLEVWEEHGPKVAV